jgi:flagellar biosynthetic protein FlhB
MSQDRTEKPTARKKKELRKEGFVARSAELSTAAGLLTLVVAGPMAVRRLADVWSVDLPAMLTASGDENLSEAQGMAWHMVADGVRALVLPVAIVAGASILASVGMTRSRPNFGLMKPKFSGLSPKHGVKKLFSAQGLSELAKAFGKLVVVVAVGWFSWHAGAMQIAQTPGTVGSMISQVSDNAVRLLLIVGLVSVVIGFGDAAWSRRRWRKKAMMTKQEVRDESKSEEVSSEVRGAIRRRQMKLSRSRMIAAVANADVVLVNPTHIAIALQYVPGSAAPIVVAKGAGEIAARIRAEAREKKVPVMENRPLARALWSGVKLGGRVPEELFEAVAKILAAVYAARRERGLAPRVPSTPRNQRTTRPTRRAA